MSQGILEVIALKLEIFFSALKTFFINVLSHPVSTLFTLVVLFFGSLVLFWIIYIFLHHSSLANIHIYKGRKLHGFTLPTYAYLISGELLEQKLVEAQNELRLSKRFGDYVPNWQSFSQDTSLERQFPDQKESQERFKDTFTRGMLPSELIEVVFAKYSDIQFRFTSYRDNSLKEQLPFHVIQEYYGLLVEETKHKILTEQKKYLALQKVAEKLLRVLTSREVSNLGRLHFALKMAMEDVKEFKDKEKVKEFVYGYFLNVVGSYQVAMKFDFSGYKPRATYFDLFYLSLQNSTSNRPSDITPVTYCAKIVSWLQLLFSYFLLAFSVATIISLIDFIKQK